VLHKGWQSAACLLLAAKSSTCCALQGALRNALQTLACECYGPSMPKPSQMQPPDLSDSFHMRCNGIDHDLDGFRRMWNARKVLLAQPLCFTCAECLLQLGHLPSSFSTVKRSKTCRPCAQCTSMLRSCCASCVRLLCLQMQKLLQSVEFEVLDLFGRGDSVSGSQMPHWQCRTVVRTVLPTLALNAALLPQVAAVRCAHVTGRDGSQQPKMVAIDVWRLQDSKVGRILCSTVTSCRRWCPPPIGGTRWGGCGKAFGQPKAGLCSCVAV